MTLFLNTTQLVILFYFKGHFFSFWFDFYDQFLLLHHNHRLSFSFFIGTCNSFFSSTRTKFLFFLLINPKSSSFLSSSNKGSSSSGKKIDLSYFSSNQNHPLFSPHQTKLNNLNIYHSISIFIICIHTKLDH